MFSEIIQIFLIILDTNELSTYRFYNYEMARVSGIYGYRLSCIFAVRGQTKSTPKIKQNGNTVL